MKNLSSQNPQQPNTAPSLPLTTQGQETEERNPHHPPTSGDDNADKARCDWDFHLSTVISSSIPASDAIGVVEFDHTNSFLATGGVARRIRIYAASSLLASDDNNDDDGNKSTRFLDHAAACEYYICTPAKLSSLKWKPGSGSRVIGSGDYDGVVMEYDLERRMPVFERDEHGGKRVWSIDYGYSDPNIGASGSDDGTMQMWDTRCHVGTCISSVQPNGASPSPVCSVEFNPFGGPLVAVGCADRKIYGYDVRMMPNPVFVLDGHRKAVTYTRFMDLDTIVSSSIDGCLKMWCIEDQSLVRTYMGHVNTRRFVGLSVWRYGGLLSCGSENNRVFVYDKRWGDPIWVRGFEVPAEERCERGFVSGVCWRQSGDERCMLVAGGSDGVLQVFEGERKSCL